jgi:hypothetical protein
MGTSTGAPLAGAESRTKANLLQRTCCKGPMLRRAALLLDKGPMLRRAALLLDKGPMLRRAALLLALALSVAPVAHGC